MFEYYIRKSIEEIKNNNLSLAKEYIHSSMVLDDSSPSPHNLLGIIAEIQGHLSLAGNHYRASCSLDATFKPSLRNLERITNYYYRFNFKNLDFGEKTECQEENIYTIKYDSNNVGHLLKNTTSLHKKLL